MRNRAIAILSVPLLLAACERSETLLTEPSGEDLPRLAVAADPASLEEPGAPQRHLVLLKGNSTPIDFQRAVQDLGGAVDFIHPLGIAIVSGLGEEGAGALASSKEVARLEPDRSFRLEEPGARATSRGDRITSPSNPAGAYFYPRQWHLRAISADDAWAAGSLGSPSVTVAILDTGIDYLHADLVDLVDAARSASFVPFDDYWVPILFPERLLITDLNLHGTHVAATVASNAYVAAGVTSATTLMAVKICDVFGSCAFGSLIEGFLHAVDNGADVINLSLGGGFTKASLGWYVGFINRVFNYAHQRNVTVVVAAGNEGENLDRNANTFATYCDAPHVICASATGPTAAEGVNGPWTDVDAFAPYSNFGSSSISVAAPGGNYPVAVVWAACSQTSLLVPDCQTSPYWALGIDGTSMASPHVAGLAALLVAEQGRRPASIKAAITRYADDLGKPGADPYYGKGRINVARALGVD